MNQMSAQLSLPTGLSISVVVYNPERNRLLKTLASVSAAYRHLRTTLPGYPVDLYVIDNGGLGDIQGIMDRLHEQGINCQVLIGHGNVGYGRGHNLAIRQATRRFHLILNPDIDLESNALAAGCEFLDSHTDVGLLTPWVGQETGGQQYLCRRFPAVIDLLARGFLPARMRECFAKRLAHYEMRDVINDQDVVWAPPIVSGCFMLFRTEVLQKLGGFDPRYFLYFEDYDLSLRTHEVTRVAYVPSVRVVHHGGGASRKGFAHIRMFAASAFKFYNRFGWKWW